MSIALLGALVAGVALWRVRRSTTAPSVGAGQPVGHARGRARHTARRRSPGSAWPRAPRAVPGRIAVGGTVLSVMGVLAAFVFSASVDHLRAEPDLYGWGFDAVIESEDLTDDGATTRPCPQASTPTPTCIDRSTLYSQIPITLDGTPTFATAVTDPAESLDPVMVRGDAPRGADELAVGGDTLASIGARRRRHDRRLARGGRRTGCGSPASSRSRCPRDGGSAATGAYLSPASVVPLDVPPLLRRQRLVHQRRRARAPGRMPTSHAFAARYRDADTDLYVDLPAPPGEIDRLTAVEDLPRYMAIFMAALAAAAISFATTTTVRQRRRDLAVLRVLGMTGAARPVGRGGAGARADRVRGAARRRARDRRGPPGVEGRDGQRVAAVLAQPARGGRGARAGGRRSSSPRWSPAPAAGRPDGLRPRSC